MKKAITLMSICLAGLTLAACGNNNSDQAKTNSSLKAENSSLKAANARSNSSQTNPTVDKYDNAEYALAAYLKFQKTDASSLSNTENMTWQQQGNRYIIGFGGHTTSMTVNKNDVLVTFDDVEGDHMGSGNGHRTYTKAELAQFIKGQKDDIDNLLRNHGSSEDSNSANNSANKDAESSSNATAEENDSDDDEPTSSNHHNNQQRNVRTQASGFAGGNINSANNSNGAQTGATTNGNTGTNNSGQNNPQ